MRSVILVCLALVTLSVVASGCGGGTTTTDAARVDSGGSDAAAEDGAITEDAAVSDVDSGDVEDASTASDAAQNDAGEPVACGGRAGDTCAANEYCEFTRSATCGFADAQGVCAPRPAECPAGTTDVCGCDGSTYGSECLANAAGTGVLHDGPCR